MTVVTYAYWNKALECYVSEFNAHLGIHVLKIHELFTAIYENVLGDLFFSFVPFKIGVDCVEGGFGICRTNLELEPTL